ncbi:MAG: thioredoxin family protein [Deltaproteobacteria bacterium]|nr:thioredoxin family protein [Deltaproteobacteria bacterium]
MNHHTFNAPRLALTKLIAEATITSFLALWCCITPALAQRVDARIITDYASVSGNQRTRIGVHFKIEPGWHLYWKNPGDSGMAPKIKWTVPEAVKLSPLPWPAPKRLPVGHLMNFGYENELLLGEEVTLRPGFGGDRATISAEIEWLVCKEDCLPGEAKLSADLEVTRNREESADSAIFERFEKLYPVKGAIESATFTENSSFLELSFKTTDNIKVAKDLFFFPEVPGIVRNAAPQRFTAGKDRSTLRIEKDTNAHSIPRTFKGVLTFDGSGGPEAVTIDAHAARSASAAASLQTVFFAQIALAFIAGIILNVMPCVFPVLSIKVLRLIEISGKDTQLIRHHGIMFSAGVVVSFLVLALILIGLRGLGEGLGWGFQLQSPLFVMSMAMFITALALNLLGVFEVGASVQRAAGKIETGSSSAGSFVDGVLATLLASPCSAPFMGGAVAYALNASSAEGLALFAVLGFGMAFPFLLLSFFPAALRLLPRPGEWMELFKKFMAFPLFATIAWLVWVFGKLSGDNSAFVLLLSLITLSVGFFILGTIGPKQRSAKSRRVCGVIGLGIVLLSIGAAASYSVEANEPANQDSLWREYDEHLVNAAIAEERPVFIDFTAAWCITCQVNKALVLSDAAVIEAFKRRDVLLLRGDWTRRSEKITAALLSYGYKSVPLYVLHNPAKRVPVIFPSVLSISMINDALGELP